MIRQWITPWGDYYVGDKLHSCDIEVEERPPLTSEQEAEIAKDALSKMDQQSIRPLRSIIVAMIEGRAPVLEDEKFLVEIEAQAKQMQTKLK